MLVGNLGRILNTPRLKVGVDEFLRNLILVLAIVHTHGLRQAYFLSKSLQVFLRQLRLILVHDM